MNEFPLLGKLQDLSIGPSEDLWHLKLWRSPQANLPEVSITELSVLESEMRPSCLLHETFILAVISNILYYFIVHKDFSLVSAYHVPSLLLEILDLKHSITPSFVCVSGLSATLQS